MKFAITLMVVSLPLLASTWEVDESHTAAKFKVKHLMISNVQGQVSGAKGTLEIDDKDTSKMTGEITLDATTINTNNAKRDVHLKDADFFDVAKFPTFTFKIGKVTKGKAGKLSIAGDLTMKGITKPVTLKDASVTGPVKDPWGGNRRGLSATTQINRKDWGITWNKTLDGGGLAVGDTVDIDVEMELIAKAEPKQ